MASEITFTVRPHLDLSALRADAVKLIEFCDKMEKEQKEKKNAKDSAISEGSIRQGTR